MLTPNNSAIAGIAQSTEEVERHIIEYWNLQNAYSKANKNNINNGELYISQDEIKYRQSARNQKTLKEIADYLQLVRQRIINELSLHFDKERIIGELTEDYFNIELKKSNFDTVVIKLCVRFEAVLKCDFGYVGSFIDMIDKYCSEKLTWTEDDGWGYDITRSDDETISLLHKLRKVRNSIVHAEKTNARLTSEELQKCIDYICKL